MLHTLSVKLMEWLTGGLLLSFRVTVTAWVLAGVALINEGCAGFVHPLRLTAAPNESAIASVISRLPPMSLLRRANASASNPSGESIAHATSEPGRPG